MPRERRANSWQLARDRQARRRQRQELNLRLQSLGAAGNMEGVKRLLEWVAKEGAPGEREFLEELRRSAA